MKSGQLFLMAGQLFEMDSVLLFEMGLAQLFEMDSGQLFEVELYELFVMDSAQLFEMLLGSCLTV